MNKIDKIIEMCHVYKTYLSKSKYLLLGIFITASFIEDALSNGVLSEAIFNLQNYLFDRVYLIKFSNFLLHIS